MVKIPVLALIPARGGSKGIPRKNIRLLGGVPLIAYSIAAGLQSRLVGRVIVSTDDEEIASVARAWGAETPFLRPAEHAQDATTDLPVFQHALEWLAEHENYRPEIVVQLRPTSPFRPLDCVDRAVQALLDHPDADSVRGVVPSGENPYKMWRLSPDGPMRPLLDAPGLTEPYNMPRQKLPPTYWQTGHIDAVRAGVVLQGSMSGAAIYPLEIDPAFKVDLDNLLDWQRAEWNLANRPLEMVRPQASRGPDFSAVRLLVLDFDGVLTDDRVYVNQDGVEMVAANRSDGMGIALLKKAGIQVLILSTETNPVVTARARKLDVPVIQGVGNKAAVLQEYLQVHGFAPREVVYLGNDVNDLPCFPLVGCAAVVADAHPDVLPQANLILTRKGGFGAVRELCDMLRVAKST